MYFPIGCRSIASLPPSYRRSAPPWGL